MLAAPEAPALGKVIIAVVALAMFVCAYRLFVCRLDVSAVGLDYHGLLVRRRYAWEDVDEVTYEQVDEKVVPVVSICLSGRFPHSGVLTTFSGYEVILGRKNRRVERQVRRVVELQRAYSRALGS